MLAPDAAYLARRRYVVQDVKDSFFFADSFSPPIGGVTVPSVASRSGASRIIRRAACALRTGTSKSLAACSRDTRSVGDTANWWTSGRRHW